MPKNRSTVYTVVREKLAERIYDLENDDPDVTLIWGFDALVGTYLSLARAEEVAAATIQHYIDAGMDAANAAYRCTVKPSTWYDE